MYRVVVICGAGASSSFLAHFMRKAATVRGLALVIEPQSLDGLLADLRPADVLLVGHHLAPDFSGIHELTLSVGARAALLPPMSPSAAAAEVALDVAIALSGTAASDELLSLTSGSTLDRTIESRESGAHHG